MKIKLKKSLNNYIKYKNKKIDDSIVCIKDLYGNEHVVYFTSKHKGRLHGEVPAVLLKEEKEAHVELEPVYLYLNIDIFSKNITINKIDHLVPLESKGSILGEFVNHNKDNIEIFEDKLLDFIIERLYYIKPNPYLENDILKIEIDEYFDLILKPVKSNLQLSMVLVSDNFGNILYDPKITLNLNIKDYVFNKKIDLEFFLNIIEEKDKNKL